jgi:exopolysaccharide biosynthesis polyprenyl glycosylphosphotransferase
MLGKTERKISEASFVLDVVVCGLILAFSYGMLAHFKHEWESLLQWVFRYPFRIEPTGHLRDQGWVFVLIWSAMILGLRIAGFYPVNFNRCLNAFLKRLCIGILAGLACAVLVLYILGFTRLNRSLLLGHAGVFAFFLLCKEGWIRAVWIPRYVKAHPLKVIVIAGSACISNLDRFVDGASFRRFYCENMISPDRVDTLADILKKTAVDAVFLQEPIAADQRSLVLTIAREQGVPVCCFQSYSGDAGLKCEWDQWGDEPVVIYRNSPVLDGRFWMKRVMDYVLASIVLISLLPLFVLIGVGVRLSSQGPIFFTQLRTGFRKKPFKMLKFRTMIIGSELIHNELKTVNEMKGPVFKMTNDPRVTRFGRFLRRYSLDELPQLWNVLRGEMSLVGPRPLPLYETDAFGAFSDYRRYSVLPGITGLWQVSGRSNLKDFSEWVALDLRYVDEWSLSLDIKILLKSIPVVLRGNGAH